MVFIGTIFYFFVRDFDWTYSNYLSTHYKLAKDSNAIQLAGGMYEHPLPLEGNIKKNSLH